MKELSLYDRLNLKGIRCLSEQLKKNPHETYLLTEDLKAKKSIHELSSTSLFIIGFIYREYGFLKYFDL
jgi:predicted transcriptional regulator